MAFKQTLSEIELVNIIKKDINWHNTARRQLTLNGMTLEEYQNHTVQGSV
ncbi:IS3 family transposase [Lactiplantibacillus plantarum]